MKKTEKFDDVQSGYEYKYFLESIDKYGPLFRIFILTVALIKSSCPSSAIAPIRRSRKRSIFTIFA